VGRCIVGVQDKLIDPTSAATFADTTGFELSLYQGCGHAVPYEEPVRWRREVLDFFDDRALAETA